MTAHRLALASEHVVSTSIEAQEFQDLSSRYGVRAVPKIVVNESIEFTGALPEPAYVEAVLSVAGREGMAPVSGEASSL